MKKLGLFLLILNLNATASLYSIKDGLWARCKNKSDVITTRVSQIFKFHSPTIEIKDDKVSLDLRVNFYKCEQTSRGYEFLPQSNIYFRSYDYPVADEFQTFYMHNKEISVMAFNEDFSEVKVTNLSKENKSEFSVKVEFPINGLDVNTFSNAQDKGDYYFDLSLRSIRAYFGDTTMVREYSYTRSSSYRLYLDLENKKAQF